MPEPFRVRRFRAAGAFLEYAGRWLLEMEAENNLMIGLATRMMDDPAGTEPATYFAAVELHGTVVGCVRGRRPTSRS